MADTPENLEREAQELFAAAWTAYTSGRLDTFRTAAVSAEEKLSRTRIERLTQVRDNALAAFRAATSFQQQASLRLELARDGLSTATHEEAEELERILRMGTPTDLRRQGLVLGLGAEVDAQLVAELAAGHIRETHGAFRYRWEAARDTVAEIPGSVRHKIRVLVATVGAPVQVADVVDLIHEVPGKTSNLSEAHLRGECRRFRHSEWASPRMAHDNYFISSKGFDSIPPLVVPGSRTSRLAVAMHILAVAPTDLVSSELEKLVIEVAKILGLDIRGVLRPQVTRALQRGTLRKLENGLVGLI